MIVTSLVVGAFEENTYVIVDEVSRQAAVVDPGAEPERIIATVRRAGADLQAIWLTHAHVDHVGAIAGLRAAWPSAPIWMHPLDRPLYDASPRHAAMYGIPFDPPPAPDHDLEDGDSLRLGALTLRVIHTPGHAPGLVVLYGEGVAFVGDLLFAGSIGRTDLPLSDGAAMNASLERIAALPPATVVYPGHGPATTVGEELRSNPFLTGVARVVRR